MPLNFYTPSALTIEYLLNTMIYIHMEAWPSGKAGACKALIPSSNLGASFLNHTYEKRFLMAKKIFIGPTPLIYEN